MYQTDAVLWGFIDTRKEIDFFFLNAKVIGVDSYFFFFLHLEVVKADEFKYHEVKHSNQ